MSKSPPNSKVGPGVARPFTQSRSLSRRTPAFVFTVPVSVSRVSRSVADKTMMGEREVPLPAGIGIGVSDIRSSGSLIHGTNGQSTGLVPMLRNFNEAGRYVNQVNFFSACSGMDATPLLSLRLHSFKFLPLLQHISIQIESADQREKVTIDHIPNALGPLINPLIHFKSCCSSEPWISIPFYVHPGHTVSSLVSFSHGRPRPYALFVNDCRNHSFSLIKHAMHPRPPHEPSPNSILFNFQLAGRQAKGLHRYLPGAMARGRAGLPGAS
jgi:hypothetical protein